MNLLLSNRALPFETDAAGLPRRIHIVPRGELFNAEANVTQVLDDSAITAILADLRNRHAKNGGLYLGEEHFIYNADRSSEAFAWGKEFSADAAGIWVENPDYTDVGAAALKNRRFKWTSFVVDPRSAGAVEPLAKNRYRILGIDTVGFTNLANGKALLVPISNRNSPGASPEAQSTATPKTNMKSIAAELGLTPEAAEEAVLAAVRQIKNRADTVAGLTTERDTLKIRNAELEAEQIDGLLAAHGVTEEKVLNRLKPVLAAMKNRADRVGYLTDCVPAKAAAKPASGRVLNRGEGKPPATGEADTAGEQERADKILNRARELQKGGVKFEAAWQQASKELAPA